MRAAPFSTEPVAFEAPPQRALAALIATIGAARFADTALAALNHGGVRAASWAVYELRPAAAPVLHLSASLGVEDTTRECFRVYRESLYRADRSFATAGGAPEQAHLLHLRADELRNADHRDAIYRRHRIGARLSVARRRADGALLAVNLYRHEVQGTGGFAAGEIDAFAGVAGAVLAAVDRHIELRDGAALPAAPPAREALARRCPALTPRELDLCERLLRGWSYDGIAADLALSLPTVKTYRRRAFERLGIHFKSELFALMSGAPH
ncbi:MAG TPA: helix-turn-helix transcriptional regulator [Methylibium sp.]|uniref:helix-turn-helix transcriptional regulator n=1 Tax=Methylibium sp. TaxID=2067992 RepID=UPI002DBC8476|nr:helix-turn-helix transcriptional regulator [Methylibium sp.]HEU4460534.1 helix-turn-helix transcriptional regulator [Methylibium sp.]